MPGMTTRPNNRVREYETIYILKGDVDADTASKVANRVFEVITRDGGKLTKVESWGRRKLSYTIGKQKRGVYTYLKFLGGGPLVTEIERNLRMQDSVIRFLTVQLRDNVLVEQVAVDPEELKFVPPEPPGEDDKDDSREKQLGFLDAAEDRRSSRRDEEGDELEGIDEEQMMNPDLAEGGDEEK